ncbi:MAG: SPOR domain-containing protein [Thermoanaerobaculia bacterium]
MSATPPGGDWRGGARRILPSVAEVAAALARTISADPAALYRVSREVVTEELARVKQGLEAAPLEILMARAEERFRALHPLAEVPKQPDLFVTAPPGPPPLPEPLPVPDGPVLPVPYEPPEEPFAAATSADLGWDRSSGEVPAPIVVPLESRLAETEKEPAGATPAGIADVLMGEAPEESTPEAMGSGDVAARRSLWILAVTAVVVVAAGLFWLVVRLLAPPSAALRGASTTKVERPTPPVLPQARAPVAVAPLTSLPAPVAYPQAAIPGPSKATSVPAPASRRVASFVTRDWTGHPPVFIVHFASHQDRASAARDAATLASTLGKPAHAVEVDLGAKGIWYRVVVGEFPRAEEARAFRAALEAKKTPGLGFVYEMRGGH